MMIAHIDVLGTRMKLWKSGEFQYTGVVFINLAIRKAWYR
jgi:hypothetical protein